MDHFKMKKAIKAYLMHYKNFTSYEAEIFASQGEISEVSERVFVHTYPMSVGQMIKDVYKKEERGDDDFFILIETLEKNVAVENSEWKKFEG